MITFWTVVLGLAILLYVILDGFDLGVGMLFAFAPDETARRHMLAAISPVWDGNETWLIFAASILFGAFPLVYATLLSALYLPLMIMLAALIFRGVAFEFRYKSRGLRPLWDVGFAGGSLVAGFIQGCAVGALVEGLAIQDGKYIGGPFGWLSPFALLCGVGLCLGYCLLGAGWLTYRTARDSQELAFRLLPRLLLAVLAFLVVAFVAALGLDLRVMHRWLEAPLLTVFPLIGLAACVVLFTAVRRRQELVPFFCGVAIFAAAFATLAVSFYPYMVPFSITVADAASPPASLSFMFWGAGLFVLPLTLIYTLVVYFVFKGKVDPDAEYH
ncbi:cytochrome d ubiquinol oxidase subunit II [Labrys monachus]|uniref:Cytochrome d ubiquinol oxidase subunit II n=1 Tax=Labrys monachus TaxID=217067 RepID=A0ABU0F8E3_9HYPH|nr:cytochrome d ubiquinol oxidase subunit II [Labrys monachus]MDQ0390874.1 cytochrome d ubiquinol oxidase subunit II [Labrys monachus]